jgi:hypothetical protein
MKEAMKNLLLVCAVFAIGWEVNKFYSNKGKVGNEIQISILKEQLRKLNDEKSNLESKLALHKLNNIIIQQISTIREMKENIDDKIIDCSTRGYCDSSSGFSMSINKSENIELALVGFNKQSNDYQKQIETLLSNIN